MPDVAFAEGMTVVVQPNVVTRDERAGVQTGELLLIGPDGPERLHDVERGLLRIGVMALRHGIFVAPFGELADPRRVAALAAARGGARLGRLLPLGPHPLLGARRARSPTRGSR